MARWLPHVRTILFEVPRQGKLAYCLMRDSRVPRAPKVALLAALGVIASPLDFPAWIPVLGDFDMLALAVLAVKVFVEASPEEIVKEHEAAIAAQTSAFDNDLRTVFGAAREGAGRVYERWRMRRSA